MFLLIENTNFAAIKSFLVSIPESVELLAFGIGLIVAVVVLRWFLDRGKIEETDEKDRVTNN